MLLFVLCLWISTATFGQVNLSKDFKVSTSTPYSVYGKESIVIKTQGERVTVERFDFITMKEISRKVYLNNI